MYQSSLRLHGRIDVMVVKTVLPNVVYISLTFVKSEVEEVMKRAWNWLGKEGSNFIFWYYKL